MKQRASDAWDGFDKGEYNYYVDSGGRVKASYYDADRNFYAYDFTGIEAVHDEDSIIL